MKTSLFGGAVCLVAGLFTLACEDGNGGGDDMAADDTPEVAASSSELRMCRYEDFSVEITSGPNAGLKLAGKLNLVVRPAAKAFTGAFEVDAESFLVRGQQGANGQIALTVRTPEGYVSGIGPLDHTLCGEDADGIEGIAVGPTVGDENDMGGTDTGHWLLASPNLLRTFTLEEDLSVYDGGFETTSNLIIKIPESVIGNCQSGSNASRFVGCLQDFCSAQRAGTATSDAASQGFVCVN